MLRQPLGGGPRHEVVRVAGTLPTIEPKGKGKALR